MTAGPFSSQSDTDSGQEKRNCGLYLHIPFCVRKCLYCSFFSIIGEGEIPARYCRAMIRQAEQEARSGLVENCRVRTVFFGGGTPTVLPAAHLIRLLEVCRSGFCIDHAGVEISLEVNPATVTRDDLRQLFLAGFNRLSIGVQSFVDRELETLGRPHTAAQARNTFNMARAAGFANISLDLMYGLPGQTAAGWRRSLATALELAPDHLSVYELTVEAETVFGRLQKQGRLPLPKEGEILRMMELTLEETAGRGFSRYEISNYARPGRECRHNINYWQNGSYLGLGAGSVSCLGGRRFSVIADVEAYCRRIEKGDSVIGETEKLDRDARFRESVVMGLRMIRGISVAGLESRFGLHADSYYGEVLSRLQQDNLLTRRGDCLKLTERGLLLANRVMAELV